MKHHFQLSKKPIALILLVLLFPSAFCFGDDEYAFIEALIDKNQQPRLLNIVDIPQSVDIQNPVPLISPKGDFNKDGIEDIALSGIYDLKSGVNAYFLLVATRDKQTNRVKRLYFKEFSKPVYLYTPGTTGDADPKDQAFSLSQCMHCDQGEDFYWNKSKGTFATKPWSSRTITTKTVITEPAKEVPQEVIDKALSMVGAIPDVIRYVKKLQLEKKILGSRVEEVNAKANTYKVFIFEKTPKKDAIFDEVVVDVGNSKVLRRKR